jgi:hypothetical protein
MMVDYYVQKASERFISQTQLPTQRNYINLDA